MSERKPFLLRIDAALWADIERWAAEELRSANGQVEYLLREAMRKRKSGTSQEEAPPRTQGRRSGK